MVSSFISDLLFFFSGLFFHLLSCLFFSMWSLLSSLHMSCFFSCLFFHLLSCLFFFSGLFSSTLFFSCLVLSCPVLSLFLSVSLCLSVCVVWCVWCPRVYVQKHLRVYVQNASVCTGTTPAHGGGRGEGRAGHRQFCLPKFAHVRLSLDPRGSPKKPLVLTHSRSENRSRTTRSRVLQSFALPDEPVHCQQS